MPKLSSKLTTKTASAKNFIKDAKLVVYKGAPHGMCTTHKDKVNEELLAFIKA